MEDLETLPNSSQHESHHALTQHLFLGISNTFAPKLFNKLQENNFLLWNQQVRLVILSHKLHKIMVNPQIPPMLLSNSDRIVNIVSEKYEAWVVQDQAMFTWFLSTISEVVLPRLLSCKHAHEIWDKIHKHFNSQMKSRVH